MSTLATSTASASIWVRCNDRLRLVERIIFPAVESSAASLAPPEDLDMAYRPTWQGHLKLSLVSCPVALYTAINSGGDVHFNLINPKTNNRIKMITTDPDTGPIERSELVKGYEVSKGQYILLTNDEINSVKLESTKTIEIERFVAGEEIDRLYWDNPYFLAPNGKVADEAFGVIRTAMEKSGQIALGRVVIGTRERILALEPRGKGILAYTIRSDAEVRDPEEIFHSISAKAADPKMISIAEKIIEQQEGPFDPSQFVDRYEEALKALIADKKKGHKPAKVAEPEDTNVIDLMSALRASLSAKGNGQAKHESKGKAKATKLGTAAKSRIRKAS
jgi:DNA end-binding protein Ku